MAVTMKVAVTRAPIHCMVPAWLPFNPASSWSWNWSTELASCWEALNPCPSPPLLLGDIGWESQDSLNISIAMSGPVEPICLMRGEGRGGSVSKRPLAAREAGMLAKPWFQHPQRSKPWYTPTLSLAGSHGHCLSLGTCHPSLGLFKQPSSFSLAPRQETFLTVTCHCWEAICLPMTERPTSTPWRNTHGFWDPSCVTFATPYPKLFSFPTLPNRNTCQQQLPEHSRGLCALFSPPGTLSFPAQTALTAFPTSCAKNQPLLSSAFSESCCGQSSSSLASRTQSTEHQVLVYRPVCPMGWDKRAEFVVTLSKTLLPKQTNIPFTTTPNTYRGKALLVSHSCVQSSSWYLLIKYSHPHLGNGVEETNVTIPAADLKQKSVLTDNPEDFSGSPILELGTSLQAKCSPQQVPGSQVSKVTRAGTP
jgi:hypothetical protein